MQARNAIPLDDRVSRSLGIVVYAMLALACIGLALALVAPGLAQAPLIAGTLACLCSAMALGLLLGRRSFIHIETRNLMVARSRETSRQMQELFAMTDILQAAEDHADAGAILTATAQRLLPDFGGALYVFNNSRDRLDMARSWNEGEGFTPSEVLLEANCWALKRGKPHINDPAADTLCCMHHIGAAATVEVPMMARGQVHGLLILSLAGENAYEKLMEVRRLGRALADSMSLALSNIALREKLRTQSLRDPLTGLYNRRYMQDALERYISLGERTGSPTSVLMIDLDNFKRVNDTCGHAKGDAVLRDVAAQLVAALRPSDIVSRYGGEELLVIMPNCPVEDAGHKAEVLRERIAALTDMHGCAISASFGVACVPDTAGGTSDVIPMADGALYAAKQAGKNCVRLADRRAGREDFQPRLAFG